MTDIDLATIEHLDFDVTEKPKEACLGFKVTYTVTRNGAVEEKECSNPVRVMTVRSCCGAIGSYCIGCYNRICSFHAEIQVQGKPSGHGGHDVTGKPFCQVEFV